MLAASRNRSIAPSEELEDNSALARAVGRFYDAFSTSLDSEGSLEDISHCHAAGLACQQRLRGVALPDDRRNTPLRDRRPALPQAGGCASH